jgi:hypothetical protein
MPYMHPHVSGTECVGFLKARHSWEPGSSFTTGESYLFPLLLKVSGANIHWTKHKSYLSYSLKSSNNAFLHDLALAKLSSTAWVWNPHGISKLVNKVDCCLSYDSFLALCSRQQCGPSSLQNPSQRDTQRTPAMWHASQSQSQRTSYLQATTSPTAQKHRGGDAQ